MILPNIETFIGCESSFEEASIVLYGAPFDSKIGRASCRERV